MIVSHRGRSSAFKIRDTAMTNAHSNVRMRVTLNLYSYIVDRINGHFDSGVWITAGRVVHNRVF